MQHPIFYSLFYSCQFTEYDIILGSECKLMPYLMFFDASPYISEYFVTDICGGLYKL
jgi:hypothetical protein